MTTATTNQESAILHRNGQVLDHRSHQAKDVSKLTSARQDEKWAPLASIEAMDETDFVPVSPAKIPNKSSKVAFKTLQINDLLLVKKM